MLTQWSFPTRVEFGAGALAVLPKALHEGLGKRPLLVTDATVSQLQVFAQVRQCVEAAGLSTHTFDGVSPNPIAKDVSLGVTAYQEAGCDSIIAVGGGSAMDGAKAIKLMVSHPGGIEDYDERVGGYERIGAVPMPALVTIPTTAGTGSEVGRSTVIIHPTSQEKMVIFHPTLMPNLALVDPELMRSMPPQITAATGMDALTHNIESFLAKGYHPMCDGIALEGVRLCAKSLKTAVANGNDLAARTDMAAASLMGAVAFQKGLGVTHSLAHPLSTLAGLHHGLANAVMLPHAMRFNAEVAAERFVPLAWACRANGEHSAPAFIDWLSRLCDEIGIPSRLSQLGVTEELIEPMSAQAFDDGCHQSNPRTCTLQDLKSLYLQAY